MPIIKAVTIAASDCEPESVIYNALQLFLHLIRRQTVSSLTMNSKQALLIVRKLKDVLTRVCLYVTQRLKASFNLQCIVLHSMLFPQLLSADSSDESKTRNEN